MSECILVDSEMIDGSGRLASFKLKIANQKDQGWLEGWYFVPHPWPWRKGGVPLRGD